MLKPLAGVLRALLGLTLLLATLVPMPAAVASEGRRAALELSAWPLLKVPEAGRDMSTLPKAAQARCPGGQLVFLSRACGCNGACCQCSRQAPYLNHCTCRCEASPSPCAQGHSAGRP